MTDSPPIGSTDPTATQAPEPIPFARLRKELRDLDFDQAHTDDPDTTIYATTDSPVTVEFDNNSRPPTAHLINGHPGQPPTWRVSFTTGTPDRVAIMVLYATLNADTDPLAALDSAASALGLPLAALDSAASALGLPPDSHHQTAQATT
jgi:hypothetical protein